MSIADVTRTVVEFFEQVVGRSGKVVSVEADGEGWRVLVESIEECDYPRRLGKSDILGVYEVRLDRNLEVLSYTRTGLRERTALQATVR
jgi:hypothetical protein